MKLTITEQYRVLLSREHLTLQEVADRLHKSRQAVNQKLARGFDESLIEYANAIGYDVKIDFVKRKESEQNQGEG